MKNTVPGLCCKVYFYSVHLGCGIFEMTLFTIHACTYFSALFFFSADSQGIQLALQSFYSYNHLNLLLNHRTMQFWFIVNKPQRIRLHVLLMRRALFFLRSESFECSSLDRAAITGAMVGEKIWRTVFGWEVLQSV